MIWVKDTTKGNKVEPVNHIRTVTCSAVLRNNVNHSPARYKRDPSKIVHHRGPLKRQHKEKDNGKTWEVPGGRSLWKLGSASSVGGAHLLTKSPPQAAFFYHDFSLPSYNATVFSHIFPAKKTTTEPSTAFSASSCLLQGCWHINPSRCETRWADTVSNWSLVESQLLPWTTN